MDAIDKTQISKVDEKGFIADDLRDGIFRKYRMKNENRTCFECTARNPTWISLTYGVYLCLECSGEHRRKGVHISYVRSVELDRFTPHQVVQMACGGNGKAWAYFKQHGMGKTSDTGMAVVYNSKIATRYKQDMEKNARTACDQLGIVGKATGSNNVDPVDEAAEQLSPIMAPAPAPKITPQTATNSKPKISPPSPTAKPAPAPAHVVVRRSEPVAETSAPAVSTMSKPGFAGPKQKAKQIDFDFDFDDLEAEAAKPPPVVAKPEPIMGSNSTPSVPKPVIEPVSKPPQVRSQPPSDLGTNKFNNKKAISSDDFFGDEIFESAGQKMERENRYNKFSSSGAISSDSFFGNGDPEEERNLQRGASGDGEDWKAVASMAAGKGAEMAKQGISMGAEFITTYLNKVRD